MAESAGSERWSLWLAAAIMVAAGWYAWDGMREPVEHAPGFTLTSTGLENGTMGPPVTFSLSQYAGQTVVLDLMAVNCAACETVADHVLKPLQRSHPDVVILSVDTWADPATGQDVGGFETREHLVALQEERNLTWRHALDTDEVWLKYQAIALPKVVVVGPEQQMVAQFSGVPSREAVERAVERAEQGGAAPASMVRLPILGLAAVAGVAAFFAPCSVGLVPAYMGMLLGSRGDLRHVLRAAAATGAGVLAVYAGLAMLLMAAGDWLAQRLDTIQVLTGFALVLVGVGMFFPALWRRLARLGAHVDARRGFFAFGVGYAAASFGCTGPVFLPILVGAFARGTSLGLAAMAVYAAALVVLLLAAAGLVAAGRQGRLQALLQNARWVAPLCASLFVLAGLYVLWFHERATGRLF